MWNIILFLIDELHEVELVVDEVETDEVETNEFVVDEVGKKRKKTLSYSAVTYGYHSN